MHSTISIIEERTTGIIHSLPAGVSLVAAAKTRTVEEVQAAVKAGVKILGYNYVQEAEQMQAVVGGDVQWHLIGHLQKNKVKKAVKLFDMIQTLDSPALADTLNAECAVINKKMPVLIEINSGRENNKAGLFPEAAEECIRQIKSLPNLHVQGLMTMGPYIADPEKMRPYFRETRILFERLEQSGWPEIQMRYLSMGMSDSNTVAIEEGANMVRLGTILFGVRG